MARIGTAMVKILELYEVWFWGLFTTAYCGWAFTAASRKGYWFDELVTYHVDRLPDWGAVWNALRQGVDANPPLMHILNRAALQVAGDSQIAQRASSILGFWLACFCLYWIVRRKSPAVVAWLAAIFPLASGAHAYAIEARPYGLVLGFTALAYLCWQRRWHAGFAVSAALLVSSHYYAVYATIPFWMAEAFRLFRSRRFEWKGPLALVVGYLPLALYWPLIAGARQYASDNAYAMPSWNSMSDVYGFLLGSLVPFLALAIGWLVFLASHRALSLTWRLTITETVLAVGFCILPLVVVLISRFVTHGLMPRYTLPASIGISIVSALLAETVFTRGQIAILLLAFSGYIAAERLVSLRGLAPARTFEWTQQIAAEPDVPVVYGSPTMYVELFQTAGANLRKRFYTLADASEEKRRKGSTAEDLGAIHLALAAPLHVESPTAFLARRRRFYFVQPPIHNAWALERIVEDGADIRLVASSSSSALYLVTMKDVR